MRINKKCGVCVFDKKLVILLPAIAMHTLLYKYFNFLGFLVEPDERYKLNLASKV